MPNGNKAIQTKSLSILEDQMQHEFLACKKAEHHAQMLQNPTLQTLANDISKCHRQRYQKLLDYLNSHA